MCDIFSHLSEIIEIPNIPNYNDNIHRLGNRKYEI